MRHNLSSMSARNGPCRDIFLSGFWEYVIYVTIIHILYTVYHIHTHTHVYYRFWVYVIEFPFMLLVGPVGSAVGEVSMLLEDSDSHTLMPTTSELHFNPLGPSDQHLLLPDGFLAPVLPHSLSPQSNLHTAARMTPQSVILLFPSVSLAASDPTF